jgi:hypothetical protein
MFVNLGRRELCAKKPQYKPGRFAVAMRLEMLAGDVPAGAHQFKCERRATFLRVISPTAIFQAFFTRL